jgi:hypothetical protein
METIRIKTVITGTLALICICTGCVPDDGLSSYDRKRVKETLDKIDFSGKRAEDIRLQKKIIPYLHTATSDVLRIPHIIDIALYPWSRTNKQLRYRLHVCWISSNPVANAIKLIRNKDGLSFILSFDSEWIKLNNSDSEEVVLFESFIALTKEKATLLKDNTWRGSLIHDGKIVGNSIELIIAHPLNGTLHTSLDSRK